MSFADNQPAQAFLFELPPPVPPARAPAPRRAPETEVTAQVEIDLERLRPGEPWRPVPIVAELQMPASRADCRGPGICPLFRCRYNIALRVKLKGAVKVDGGGPGTTLRPVPRGRKAVRRRTERMAEAIVQRLEIIGASCVLDLVEGGRMSIAQAAAALGVTEEIVRLEMLEAAHGVDIALARARRQEDAAQHEAAGELLYQIRRKR